MKAMVLKGYDMIENKPLSLEERDIPSPGDDEVLIKVEVCGVCRTDLHEVEGEIKPELPIIPGHQVVGKVVKVGEGVSKVRIGDRVGVPWFHTSCKSCEYCQKGLENLCEKGIYTGFNIDGGYAEYMIAKEDAVYKVPEGIDSPHVAPLLCAGVIGYRAFRLSGAKSGYNLGLYGFGASAHIVIQIAIYKGCDVYVFTRSEGHRKLAESLGAKWVGTADDKPPKTMDASIIFAPAGPLVPKALSVLSKGGRLTLAGIYMTPIPEMDYDLLYHEREIKSVANSTRRDVEELLALSVEIPIKTTIKTYSLEEANKALEDVKHSRIEGTGVLVMEG